jgi:hypothetical protein
LEECAIVARQRVGACPTDHVRLRYGHLLQKLGKHREAVEQYTRASRDLPWREYNLAAACWMDNRQLEGLDHLLRGLVLDSEGLWDPEYWEQFGDCWSQPTRKLALAVVHQPSVRVLLTRYFERRSRPRKLVSSRSQPRLLEKAQEAAKKKVPRFLRISPILDIPKGRNSRRREGHAEIPPDDR